MLEGELMKRQVKADQEKEVERQQEVVNQKMKQREEFKRANEEL
jgi:hypothetical protein